MKAVLQEIGIAIPKTHDLIALLGLVVGTNANLTELNDDCTTLSDYAVDFGYPGHTTENNDAADALAAAIAHAHLAGTRKRIEMALVR